MDRHEVPGATAEDVAKAHTSDLAVAANHDVQFLSYWFDADNGGVFCFARAPTRESLEAVHRESHGIVPNEIIDVSEDAVLRFLGSVHDPVDHTELTSPFRTILFTDLEGSTALAERLGTESYLELLREHDLIVRRALVAARGREIKHTGDGIMAAFDRVPGALECALAVQTSFAERSAAGAEPDCRVRIGMAAGEPVDHNDDLFGAAVNLASRLCDAADPGATLVSDLVHERGTACGFVFGGGGTRRLKGFSRPVRAYELIGKDGSPVSAPAIRSRRTIVRALFRR